MQLREHLLTPHTQHLVAIRGSAYCQFELKVLPIAPIVLLSSYIQTSCYHLYLLLSHGWIKRVL